jgi:drug/metabolite transporter (DMT)-like permease
MIYMGIFVSTLTIIFQNWAQKENRNPTQTAIIFNLEPVFAAIFAFIIAGEILTFLQLIGCCIIFISILIAVYDKKRD